MIVENQFPKDTRVRNEARSLKGDCDVTVIALKGEGESYHGIEDGVEVIRVPEFKLWSRKSNGKTAGVFKKVEYILQYLIFTALATAIFVATYPRRRYRVLHAHNPPDTLFVVGLLGKIFSTKFVYDHHDLSPELFLARFNKRGSLIHRLLLLCEKLSCRTADAVIATNETFKKVETGRDGVALENVFVVRNDPILAECRSTSQETAVKRSANTQKTIILYLGCVNPQDGVDVLLHSIHHLVNELGIRDILCLVVGSGDALEDAKKLAQQLEIQAHVEFTGYVLDRDEVKRYLQMADICVEPAPDNDMNRMSTFIKVMEYMAAGKPIVAFNLEETAYSSNGSALLVSPGDVEAFALAIRRLMEDSKLRSALGNTGLARIMNTLNWDRASENLLQAYRHLLQRDQPSTSRQQGRS